MGPIEYLMVALSCVSAKWTLKLSQLYRGFQKAGLSCKLWYEFSRNFVQLKDKQNNDMHGNSLSESQMECSTQKRHCI